jgi:hypothetical protein
VRIKAKDRSHTTGDKICMITEQVHLQHSSPVRESQGDTGSGQIDDAKQKQEIEAKCMHPCPLPPAQHRRGASRLCHAARIWLLAPALALQSGIKLVAGWLHLSSSTERCWPPCFCTGGLRQAVAREAHMWAVK